MKPNRNRMSKRSSTPAKTWQTFSALVRRLSSAGRNPEANLNSAMFKSSLQSADIDATSSKKSINSSNLCSKENSTTMKTNPNETNQRVRAELLVYLNRLRVIHGLTELEVLEIFNEVGTVLLKSAIEDRAVGL